MIALAVFVVLLFFGLYAIFVFVFVKEIERAATSNRVFFDSTPGKTDRRKRKKP